MSHDPSESPSWSHLDVHHVLIEQDLAVDLAALDQGPDEVFLGERKADLGKEGGPRESGTTEEKKKRGGSTAAERCGAPQDRIHDNSTANKL